VGASVGARVETENLVRNLSSPSLELRLLGPLKLLRDGRAVTLPPSRKVKALLAYLVVAPGPVPRERLCDLLWEVPNDPRGELRWCLSKLRTLLDDRDGRRRVLAAEDQVSLDVDDCRVDALALLAGARTGFATLAPGEAKALLEACHGDFLEGMGGNRSVGFGHWLAGRRSEFHSLRAELAAAISARHAPGGTDALPAVRAWLELAPLDAAANIRFLEELLARRMPEECTRHLAAAERLFSSEDIDFAPVREAWKRLRSLAPARVADHPAPPQVQDAATVAEIARHGGSVAVMPFREMGGASGGRSALGDALTHDVISRLARMRSLFVIARGSVFALAERDPLATEIAEILGVEYLATGVIERQAEGMSVSVEVADTASARIVWTERFVAHSQERLAVLDEIGDGIVSSIAAEIENAERNRAILKPPESLDAWEAYHRGLWHMYRFTSEENDRAAEFFGLSARLDPTFSRAHAGLSFTHWQRAFQRWGDREAETKSALDAAGRSLMVDDQNPAAHWSMGRALWLAGSHDEAASELERSVRLSPNFALGHYALSFVHSQAGDPAAAIAASDHSRLLSPCDPLLFGMLGTRAMALARIGQHAEAAEWALKAATRPNAHVHILAIATFCLALAGRLEDARQQAALVRRQNPRYGVEDLLRTFRFSSDADALFRHAASLIGLGP
jgi:DNA-binding SARP family transcriptional activator